MTPDRSANIPAIAAKTNGVEILNVELIREAMSNKNSIKFLPFYSVYSQKNFQFVV